MIHQHTIHKDIIFINDLTVNTTIGQEVWEREIKQSIAISTSIITSFANINQNSLLPTNIDHKLIINLINEFCINNTFTLLESLVIGIEQLIVAKYSENILSLQIDAKQLFPTTNVKDIGVSIARTYTNQ